MRTDTIAAAATAKGGGVGIIRISGADAEKILRAVFPSLPDPAESHKLYYGSVIDTRTRAPLDDALACVMRAPRSYTGQDVAELQGHGGALQLERVLDAVVACGARRAEPGEFTRRAFESGRIDLTQAEAVAALIAARSDRALSVARAQQAGVLGHALEGLRHQVVEAIAELEGSLEFPDEQLDPEGEHATGEKIASIASEISALAATFQRGRHLTTLPMVVLAGPVNAGKSSLFNRLVGEERAIVDEESGTTRDVLEADASLDGMTVRLCDTAGERDESAAERLERLGQALGRRKREQADVVVLVIDGKRGVGAAERALWRELEGRARILAWNKCDAVKAIEDPELMPMVEISAREGSGIEGLARAVREAISGADVAGELVVTSARQEAALEKAAISLRAASASLAAGEPAELAVLDAKKALIELGRVTGEDLDEAVLDEIFSRFCIGK